MVSWLKKKQLFYEYARKVCPNTIDMQLKFSLLIILKAVFDDIDKHLIRQYYISQRKLFFFSHETSTVSPLPRNIKVWSGLTKEWFSVFFVLNLSAFYVPCELGLKGLCALLIRIRKTVSLNRPVSHS